MLAEKSVKQAGQEFDGPFFSAACLLLRFWFLGVTRCALWFVGFLGLLTVFYDWLVSWCYSLCFRIGYRLLTAALFNCDYFGFWLFPLWVGSCSFRLVDSHRSHLVTTFYVSSLQIFTFSNKRKHIHECVGSIMFHFIFRHYVALSLNTTCQQ